jgi:predicted dehydrogenase
MAAIIVISLAPMAALQGEDSSMPIRVGIIGLDSSHCTAFTQILHREGNAGDLAGVRVVAAFPGGSADFPLSRDRVQGYTEQIRAMGVEIVDSIDALLSKVDVVILGSVDGRQHLEQVELVFRAGKPVFIDKPLAHNLADVLKIQQLGRRYDVPWFSASALRYEDKLQTLMQNRNEVLGDVVGCDSFGQSRVGVGHADLAWYGVHGIETLYTIMGPGCVSVTRLQTDKSEQVTGLWDNGRVGTYRGIREHTHQTGFGATIFGTKSIQQISLPADYEGLVLEIARFFKTRRPPISEDVMVEIFAFIEAADESKRAGGVPVTLSSVIEKVRQRGLSWGAN